ncbi:transporter [Streptomyces jumonjinensis]|uniref:transporter n=1 Tax=Streptomyces jumonjinensis TaxID=1945 RepID=UPI001E2C8D42|nr:transporter [Streptomyces jumonjinensis]
MSGRTPGTGPSKTGPSETGPSETAPWGAGSSGAAHDETATGVTGGPGGSPAAATVRERDALGAGALAGVFVQLKLSLLRNGLRQSSTRTAVFVTSLVFALLFAAGQLLGLILLRGNEHAVSVTVLLTGVLALGWAVLPLFFPGGDETLDPTRLVMLPLRPRPLVAALLTASLMGIGPLFALCLLLGSAFALAHGAVALLVSVLAVPLALLVCVALARAVAAANVRLLTSRKGRDLAVLSGLVIAIGAQLVNFGVQRLGESGGLSALEPAAGIIQWLPPAAAIGAIDSASEGAYGTALAQLALTAGALYGLLHPWQRSLTKLMTAPDGSTLAAAQESKARGERSSGQHRLLPDSRTGTVMRRSLRYVQRDPKTKAAWVSALAIGFIVPLFNAFQGSGSIYFTCFASGMLGVQMYNQFGQDTSAFWMVAQTIATTKDAYAELRARALALLLVTLPYTVVVTVIVAAVLDDWQALPSATGVALAVLGAMLGTGAISSARFPYSIPQDSAYKNVAPGQTGLAWMSVLGGMLAAAALCAPVIAATIWLHSTDGHAWLWSVLPFGALYGLLLGWAGLRLAAPMAARRLPEILTAVSKG